MFNPTTPLLWLPGKQSTYYANQRSDAQIQAALEADAVAYWKLDEASGVRVDSAGANDLTDNNTVTQAVGKVGNAAQFTAANSESLEIADNAALSMNGSFTIAGWVYLDTLSDQSWLGKWQTGVANEYLLQYHNTGTAFRFVFADSVPSNVIVSASTFGAASTGTWYFILAWRDSGGQTINISVNNGAVDSTANTGGINPTTTARFLLGAHDAGVAFWNGRMDEIGIWKRLLTATEKAFLYNGGAGRTLF